MDRKYVGWEEVIAEARKKYSGEYKITVKGERFWMDAIFSIISIEFAKVPKGKEVKVTFNCWREAASIEDFLVWLSNNGYICNCLVIRPANK